MWHSSHSLRGQPSVLSQLAHWSGRNKIANGGCEQGQPGLYAGSSCSRWIRQHSACDHRKLTLILSNFSFKWTVQGKMAEGIGPDAPKTDGSFYGLLQIWTCSVSWRTRQGFSYTMADFIKQIFSLWLSNFSLCQELGQLSILEHDFNLSLLVWIPTHLT